MALNGRYMVSYPVVCDLSNYGDHSNLRMRIDLILCSNKTSLCIHT